MASSSDASCVCFPNSAAAIWSVDTPAEISDPCARFGITWVMNRVDARACTPAAAPAGEFAGGLLLRPLITITRSRNGSIGLSVGEKSKSTPSFAGVQLGIIIPFGV